MERNLYFTVHQLHLSPTTSLTSRIIHQLHLLPATSFTSYIIHMLHHSHATSFTSSVSEYYPFPNLSSWTDPRGNFNADSTEFCSPVTSLVSDSLNILLPQLFLQVHGKDYQAILHEQDWQSFVCKQDGQINVYMHR